MKQRQYQNGKAGCKGKSKVPGYLAKVGFSRKVNFETKVKQNGVQHDSKGNKDPNNSHEGSCWFIVKGNANVDSAIDSNNGILGKVRFGDIDCKEKTNAKCHQECTDTPSIDGFW